MGQRETHERHYRALRGDAYRLENSDEIRVEAFFLAAYQLIEGAAAAQGLHIQKHQDVRRELEANPFVFQGETEAIWRAFQELESRVRPRVVYGSTWTPADVEKARELFELIERICTGVRP